MALATQCPHCQTTFRVANDQLKLRAGLVRCGTCREVFNGIEHLVRPDHPAHAVSPETASSHLSEAAPASANGAPISTLSASRPDEISAIYTSLTLSKPASAHPVATEQPLSNTTEVSPRFNPAAIAAEENTYSPALVLSLTSEAQNLSLISTIKKSPDVWHRQPVSAPYSSDSDDEDPLQRMTLFQVARQDQVNDPDASTNDHANTADDVELDRLIDELQNRQWPGQKQNAPEITIDPNAHVILGEVRNEIGEDIQSSSDNIGDIIVEPRFVQQARRKQQVGGTLRTGMWIGSVLLLIALIGQASYTFRDQLAAHAPLLKPMLQRACSSLGCQLGLPMNIDGLSIESNELQFIAPARNQFALSLLMRNRSSTAQAWPNIELTLNDASEKAIARRIFTPGDYLPAATDATGATRAMQGFSRNTEYLAKLTFELSQLKASGYRVYLFYP